MNKGIFTLSGCECADRWSFFCDSEDDICGVSLAVRLTLH